MRIYNHSRGQSFCGCQQRHGTLFASCFQKSHNCKRETRCRVLHHIHWIPVSNESNGYIEHIILAQSIAAPSKALLFRFCFCQLVSIQIDTKSKMQ